jgi:hypothetical protein
LDDVGIGLVKVWDWRSVRGLVCVREHDPLTRASANGENRQNTLVKPQH